MEAKGKEENFVEAIVIGAGPSGIIQAKWMKEKGVKVKVFERTNKIGGLWFVIYTFPFHFDQRNPQILIKEI